MGGTVTSVTAPVGLAWPAPGAALLGQHARGVVSLRLRTSRGRGRMTVTIGRRELLAALCGAAAAWPLSARAQQGERMRRIGVLNTLAADDALAQARQGAFLQGLQQCGWRIVRKVQGVCRLAGRDPDSLCE